MYTQQVTINAKTGLKSKAASDFVQEAKAFSSKITVKNTDLPGSPSVNAKSIASLLTIDLAKGARAEISASGEDEKEAVDALVKLIKSGLGA